MVDDGYLIGYEDTNGDFVEVGRFNNQAEDTTQPIEVVHANSGEKIELGPNGFVTDSVSAVSADVSGEATAGSVNTDELYNSPNITRLVKDSDQTIADATRTEVTYQSADLDRAGLADLSNNAIQIPPDADISSIHLSVTGTWDIETGGMLVRILRDGNPLPDGQRGRFEGDIPKGVSSNVTHPVVETGWFDVSGGETFTVEVEQNSGGDVRYRSFHHRFSAWGR